MEQIILASSSPRRKQLMKQAGFKFKVVNSNFDESSLRKTNPATYTKKLASAKAHAVNGRIKGKVIVAADTVVYLNGKILGKPHDKADAHRMLRLLSGKTHSVVTGICILNANGNKEMVQAVTTKVKFRKLDEKMINDYVNSGESMDKAGAYAIQAKGAALIRSINGDYYNIVGLPIVPLLEMLKLIGIEPDKKL